MRQAELNELVSRHEQWFEDHATGARLHLRGEDLRGLTLAGRRLNGAILEDVDLTGADLRGTKMYGTTLKRVTLCEADLRGAELVDVELEEVALVGADLADAILFTEYIFDISFVGTRMNGAALNKTYFDGVSFKGVPLRGADFKRCCLGDVSLEGCDLRGANFHSAIFTNVDLRGADVTGADFRFAQIGPVLPGELVRVYGVRGFPTEAMGMVIGTVDLSPAGDGSQIIDGEEWLTRRAFDGVSSQGGDYIDGDGRYWDVVIGLADPKKGADKVLRKAKPKRPGAQGENVIVDMRHLTPAQREALKHALEGDPKPAGTGEIRYLEP
jgi:uncharacterized protein YjbI with pentapeptide repeats